jgi:hypothetical protein
MQSSVGHPWFHSAVERLDVRRRDRLLAFECEATEAHALRHLVGDQGELVLVMREREQAEHIAAFDWPRVRVLAHEADGSETFGAFDAFLVARATGPLLPAAAYARLVRNNLRPGGRFVVDLPAPDMVPDLRAAWLAAGRDAGGLAALVGPSDVELAAALRAAGLRNVHAALGSHLLHLTAPADLVEAFASALGLDAELRTELTHALVSRRQDPGPIDALVHRTQVGGQR